MPVVDFSAVKGLEPLPVDIKYLAKVVHAEEGLSASNQPKIEMRWEIIAPEEHAGRQVFDILSFHPDAMFRTKDVLMGLGFDSTFQGEISAEIIEGREACITLKMDDSNQRDEDGNPYPPRNKIRKVRSADKYSSATTNDDAMSGLVIPTDLNPRKAKKTS